ncbi:MAG: hypothetical protein IIB64_05665 [Proteobacteria bacterium]|nr:hypothetical protein [Pseudomonadota bacterium]
MVHTQEHKDRVAREKRQRERLAPILEKIKPFVSKPEKVPVPSPVPSPVPIPEPTPEIDPTPEVKPTLDKPLVFRDSETGRATGIELPDGRVFLGLSPEEVEAIAKGEERRTAEPTGTITAEEIASERARQETIGRIGEQPQITQEQLTAELEKLTIPANLRTALAGAGAEFITGAGAGALGGAVLGGVAGGGIGAVPGAIIGAAVGVSGVLLRNLKVEAKEDTTARGKEFRIIRSSMRLVISEVNANRITPDFAVERYNIQLGKMLKLDRALKELTSTDLKDFLSAGSDLFAQVDTWIEIEEPLLRASLEGAIISPDPTKVLTEELVSELIDREDL